MLQYSILQLYAMDKIVILFAVLNCPIPNCVGYSSAQLRPNSDCSISCGFIYLFIYL